MSSWLARQHPLTLTQSSDLPFIIREDGILLCFDNCYSEAPVHDTYNIAFRAPKHELERQSTNYFRFVKFPKLVPFEDVIELDDTIRDGRLRRDRYYTPDEPQKIAVIRGAFLARNYKSIDYDNFDQIFVVVKEKVPDGAYEIRDVAEVVHHLSWPRTVVTMLHSLCNHSFRGYCWTKSVPELTVNCLGLKREDLFNLTKSLTDTGVTFDAHWD